MRPVIFKHTWRQILEGKKTVTSREKNALHEYTYVEQWGFDNSHPPQYHVDKYVTCVRNTSPKLKLPENHRGRIMWEKGAEFGLKPAYGAPVIATLRVESIEAANVLESDSKWANLEGFETRYDFIALYAQMHDTKQNAAFLSGFVGDPVTDSTDHLFNTGIHMTLDREKYDCWKITFSLISINEDKVKQWETQNA